MDEIQSIESIDAAFSYGDKKKWTELIIKRGQIFENASFMVLHEICRAPDEVRTEHHLRMFFEWNKRYAR